MLVDASPLIYLAKLDALDVFSAAGQAPLVTPEVQRETSRPGLAYRFPDAVLIADALRGGLLALTVSDDERRVAERLGVDAGGLDRGESEVLAVAVNRRLPVLLYERRAARLARSLGLDTWSPIRLLVAGTPDREQLRDRLIRFARLVEMRFEDVDELIRSIERRRR